MADAVVDVRCGSRTADSRRCQLLVGHDAEHAAMTLNAGERTIKAWNARPSRRQEPAEMAYRYAWAPGFPSVAEDIAELAQLPDPGLPERREPVLRPVKGRLHSVA